MANTNTDIKKGMKESFDKLPWFVKLAIIIAVCIIVIVVVKRAYNAITVPIKTQQEAADARSELSALEAMGERPSYPDSKYRDLATKLYNSMAGMGTWDDDLDDVFNELNNNIDFMKLKGAFGLKDGYTMQEWLDGDLSDDRKSEINSVLADKGIKYRI